jgi:hypothetical protein
MAPIISIMRNAAVILVSTPTIRNIPPITSSRPMGSAQEEGLYSQKILEFLQYFQTLVNRAPKR